MILFQDDDGFDRYSHRWTVILLSIFIVALSAKQYVGMFDHFNRFRQASIHNQVCLLNVFHPRASNQHKKLTWKIIVGLIPPIPVSTSPI